MKLQRLVAMGPHIQEWEAAGLHKYMEGVNSVVVENCIEQPVVVVNGGLEVGEATHTLVMVVVMEMVVVCDGMEEVVEARTQDMVAVVEVVIQCKEAVVVNAQGAGVSSTCKELVEVENSMEKAVEVNLVAAVVGSGHNREGRLVGEVMVEVEASKLAVEVMVEAEMEAVVVVGSKLAVEVVSTLGEVARAVEVVVSKLGEVVVEVMVAVRKLVAVAMVEEVEVSKPVEEVRVMVAAEEVARESQQEVKESQLEAKEQELGV
ncbi:PREDICTED: uncharacterized protein LOC101299406 [Fragaria vesca subsp. vesca]